MGICSCSRHERTIPHSCVSVLCSCAFVVSFGDCSLKIWMKVTNLAMDRTSTTPKKNAVMTFRAKFAGWKTVVRVSYAKLAHQRRV